MNIDIQEIQLLLKKGRKLEAIKKVFDANRDSGIGLGESKYLVEEIEKGNEPSLKNFKKEDVSTSQSSLKISTSNGKTEVRFSRAGEPLQVITPDSPLWKEMKKAFPDKEADFLLLEKQFRAPYRTEATSHKSSLFLEKNNANTLILLVIAIIVLLLIIFIL